MRAYVIRAGDDLDLLAARMGFDAGEVWNDDQNRELRERRQDPNVLAPGDVVYLPEPHDEPQRLAAHTTNRYRAAVGRVRLDLLLTAGGPEPLANEPYEVRGAGAPISGRSDGQGHATIEVPARVRELELLLPEQGTRSVLRLGHLDPASDASGVRTRLANLGYLPPYDLLPPYMRPERSPAELEHELTAALRRFQGEHGLSATGGLDDATRDALRRAHGR